MFWVWQKRCYVSQAIREGPIAHVPTMTHRPTPPTTQLTKALQSSALKRRKPRMVNHLNLIRSLSKNEEVLARSLWWVQKASLVSLRNFTRLIAHSSLVGRLMLEVGRDMASRRRESGNSERCARTSSRDRLARSDFGVVGGTAADPFLGMASAGLSDDVPL